jgi:predicted transglutaminase-like cysteine proteinase
MRFVASCVLRCIAGGFLLVLAGGPGFGQTVRYAALNPVPAPDGNGPFGLSLSVAPAGPIWAKWRSFAEGLEQTSAALARCKAQPETCSAAETRLLALAEAARNAHGRARFGLINREINLSIAYTSDEEQYGAPDVWSSALDSLTTGQGDCEDFAIAKYVVLREAGIPADDLRLVVARVRNNQTTAHAVLAARLDGQWLMLDNRRMALLDDAHTDVEPIFAVTDKGVARFGGATHIASATADNAAGEKAAQSEALIAASTAAMAGGGTLPLLL